MMLLLVLAAHAENVIVYIDGRPIVVELVRGEVMAGPGPSPSAVTPVAPAPAGGSVAVMELLMKMPLDPGKECRSPGEAIRQQARKQVDMGDEARMTVGDERAVKDYLAALSMDPCNGFAWLGLAMVAAEAQRPDLAVRALVPATSFLPNHYAAWTLLGKQYEALGQYGLAKEAYGAALVASPGYPEARAGLARLGG